MLSYRGRLPPAPRRLALTIVEDRGYRKPRNRFPYNMLRNAALSRCEAEYVAAVDAEARATRRGVCGEVTRDVEGAYPTDIALRASVGGTRTVREQSYDTESFRHQHDQRSHSRNGRSQEFIVKSRVVITPRRRS